MLMGLVTIDRQSELKLLRVSKGYMACSSSKYVFSLKDTVKHSKSGRPTPHIEVFEFPENKTVCPVRALNADIRLTKGWRLGEAQLFVSFIAPHKKVSKSTIARWLKDTLRLTGVDTGTFQAHSIRAASSSKSHNKGLSANDILKQGNWSRESTWQRFYHKEVRSATKDFQNTLLKL